MKEDLVSPSASAMLESMRAYGYSLPVAIADVIDNSISAKASKVWLNMYWDGPTSYISIMDDGTGMTEKTLVDAMRLGSQNPLKVRAEDDLGRFGLGMKTASFSQCRCLTVQTKKDEIKSTKRWDLDYIAQRAKEGHDKWILLSVPTTDGEKRLKFPNNVETGTIILWERIDRIVGNAPSSDANAHKAFLGSIRSVVEYLGMVFHRFLDGSRPPLKIYINGFEETDRIDPWDPFLDSHPCTQSTPEETISVGNSSLVVRGYVLPHKNKLGTEEHRLASGPAGWNAQQGFYVYRNRRLLVAGSWLGLGRIRPWTKEEHYKLARIRLDIPNSMDQEWQIDVKKSIAVPPQIVRGRLLDLAQGIRNQAKQVFAHKGKYGPHAPKKEIVRPWICIYKKGSPSYIIDRKHPLVLEARKLASSREDVIESLLDIIEETVPVQQIWLDSSEKPDSHSNPFSDKTKKQIRRVIRCTYESLLCEGMSSEAARDNLVQREEFSGYEELIDELEGT